VSFLFERDLIPSSSAAEKFFREEQKYPADAWGVGRPAPILVPGGSLLWGFLFLDDPPFIE
jgi:hypothetical protein